MQLWYPYYRLREERYETFTIGPEQGKTYNSKHGYPCKAEVGIDDVNHEVEHGIHHHFVTPLFCQDFEYFEKVTRFRMKVSQFNNLNQI